ncbi:hypothetical protein BC832DRAFT_516557, partial [Gaertneriomyces semiglobifer]
LEDLFASRPQREDLVNRNILRPDNISGAIAGAQDQLKKHIIENNLKDKLQHRPSPNELVEHNILKSTPNTAMSIQAAQDELKKHLIEGQLNHALSSRPTADDLVEQNIL